MGFWTGCVCFLIKALLESSPPPTPSCAYGTRCSSRDPKWNLSWCSRFPISGQSQGASGPGCVWLSGRPCAPWQLAGKLPGTALGQQVEIWLLASKFWREPGLQTGILRYSHTRIETGTLDRLELDPELASHEHVWLKAVLDRNAKHFFFWLSFLEHCHQ